MEMTLITAKKIKMVGCLAKELLVRQNAEICLLLVFGENNLQLTTDHPQQTVFSKLSVQVNPFTK